MKLYGGSGKRKRDGGSKNTGDNKPFQPKDTLETNRTDKKDETAPAFGVAPEETEDLDAIIESYQKYRRRKRLSIYSIALTLIFCGFLLYKSFLQPPTVASPRPAVTVTQNEEADTNITSQPVSGNTAPLNTPAENISGVRKKGVYTFLLVGFDDGNGNTDTLMIGRFDSVKHNISIVSIPRDTCANVYFGYVAQKKINAVYALGGSIDALMEAASDMVGFNIDSYIVVNIKAFTALVDVLGGVYFDIPHNMNYDDPTQDLHIHFNSGYQHLTGADAVKVVRWRQNSDGTAYGGDIDRINTQHNFLMTVAKQCLSISNIMTKLDDYVQIFNTYVKTDLTVKNLTWYAREFLNVKTEDIHFYTLPSNPIDSIRGFSYGTIYVDDWVKMVNEQLNPYTQDISVGDMNIITRDKNGNLYATAGEIAGGYNSFLDYNEYIASLKKTSIESQTEETAAESAAAGDETGDGTDTSENNTEPDSTAEPDNDTDDTDDNYDGNNKDNSSQETDSGGGLFYTGGDIAANE